MNDVEKRRYLSISIKMFAKFDESNFPIVRVCLTGKPNSEEEFNNFLSKWLELYDNKKDFTFIFNTEKVSNPPLKYSLKMSIFIKELRKRDYQYLQKSIILINDKKIKWMLDFIFLIQPPVAPVYIYDIKYGLSNELDELIKKVILNPETDFIKPKKSYLSIF